MTPGNQSRDKGKRGQSEAMCVLRAKGYVVTESNSGRSCEDLMARKHEHVGAPLAKRHVFAVEVKHHRQWDIAAWRKQAKDNARKAKAQWLLMCRIPGHPFTFYVEGQGIAPAVWRLRR